MKEVTFGYDIYANGLHPTYATNTSDACSIWRVKPIWAISQITGHIYVAMDFKFDYNYESSNLWSIDSEIEMKLRKENGEEVVKKMEYRVEKDSIKFTIANMIHVGDLRALGNGVFCFSKIQIHLNLLIKSATGFPHVSRHRSFITRTNSDSEICLILGKHRYYADKFALMFSSPIFRKLLTANDEVTELEIEKDDRFDDHSFQNFLKLLHNDFDGCYDQKAIFFLAQKYEIHSILSYFEDILINLAHIYSDYHVWYSGLYALSKLQTEILKHSSVRRIEQSVKFMKEQRALFENESEYTVCQDNALKKSLEAFLVKLCELLDDDDEDDVPESKKVTYHNIVNSNILDHASWFRPTQKS